MYEGGKKLKISNVTCLNSFLCIPEVPDKNTDHCVRMDYQ
jgi:hypothetical protein